jgi:hypothetical protein
MTETQMQGKNPPFLALPEVECDVQSLVACRSFIYCMKPFDLFGMTENWRVAVLVQSNVILLMTTSKRIYVLYVKRCIIRLYK